MMPTRYSSSLKERSSGVMGSRIKWNFTKFPVAPDGTTTVTRYAPQTAPADLVNDIEAICFPESTPSP